MVAPAAVGAAAAAIFFILAVAADDVEPVIDLAAANVTLVPSRVEGDDDVDAFVTELSADRALSKPLPLAALVLEVPIIFGRC